IKNLIKCVSSSSPCFLPSLFRKSRRHRLPTPAVTHHPLRSPTGATKANMYLCLKRLPVSNERHIALDPRIPSMVSSPYMISLAIILLVSSSLIALPSPTEASRSLFLTSLRMAVSLPM
ncbi:hypothetical protein BGZ67_000625, partial [Mortierella alpina]